MDSAINKKSAKKPSLAPMVMAMIILATAPPYSIAADEKASRTGTIAAADAEEKGKSSTAGQNLTLDNIQDLAYTLQRIRQQAINVYVEATRKNVYRFDLKVPSLNSMPSTALEEQSAYLPLRKGWLAFFIGTLEPLVQILNDHLKTLDKRTEDSDIPAGLRPEWKSIVEKWTGAIKKLNGQLDVCARLIDDSGAGNIEVAKAARAIDNEVSELDQILHQASKFLSDNKICK